MPSYSNYQSDNFKYDGKYSRTDIYNPDFVSSVKIEDSKISMLHDNLDKWILFVQWARWFPDLFYDLITPQKGGIRLDLDQRVFLRCMSRFLSTYLVAPRGFG